MTFWEFTTDSSIPAFTVPQNLAWDFIIQDKDVIGSIKSRKKRRTAKRIPEIFAEHQLEAKISPLETQEDLHRLQQFFLSTHQEKEHEMTIHLDTDWLNTKLSQGRTPEKLEIFHNNELVGMKMYSYDQDGFYLSSKATTLEWDRSCELGLILDVLSFERANELGYSLIKTGKGKNLLGITLQLSLFVYKCSLGLDMHVARDDQPVRIHFAQTQPENPFVLLVYMNGEEKLFFVYPDAQPPQDISAYLPPNYQLYPVHYSEFITLQESQT